MMLIKLTVNKSCADIEPCTLQIMEKLKEKYPDLILEAKTKDDKVNSHVSISHKNSNHLIWIFCYDKNGTHEQEKKGKIVKHESNRVKKYTGIMPTEKEIKKIF